MRINFGLRLLIIGFACTAYSVMMPLIIADGLTLTFPAGPILGGWSI